VLRLGIWWEESYLLESSICEYLLICLDLSVDRFALSRIDESILFDKLNKEVIEGNLLLFIIDCF